MSGYNRINTQKYEAGVGLGDATARFGIEIRQEDEATDPPQAFHDAKCRQLHGQEKRDEVTHGAAVGGVAGGATGAGVGAGVGATIGAIVGTILVPIPGLSTAIGAGVGAAIGAATGGLAIGGIGTAAGAGIASLRRRNDNN